MSVGVQWDDDVMRTDEDLAGRVFIDAVTVRGPGENDELLRAFMAEIRLFTPDQEHPVIGMVAGLIGWGIQEEDLDEAADELIEDAAILGAAAEEIRDWLADDDILIDTCLFIEKLRLAEQWQGNRLTGVIVDHLTDLFRFDSATTLVLLQPEPLLPNDEPMPDGPERDAALARLRAGYEASGFERWQDSLVWWMPGKLIG